MKLTNEEQWIDLSHVVADAMPVWDGDPLVKLQPIANLDANGYCDSVLHSGMHAGTHVDGPLHMISQGNHIAHMPLHRFAGEGVLLNMQNDVVQLIDEVNAMSLIGKIVLLHHGHDQHWGKPPYYTDYPELDLALAHLLVKKQVKMIGMDTPSPDRSPYPLHRLFLEHGILLIENLTGLSHLISADAFEVFAFPLKIDADSSPARVVARVIALGINAFGH